MNGLAARRLAKYRAKRDSWAAKFPDSPYAKDWRACRPKLNGLRHVGNWASDGSGAYYVDSLESLGWREIGRADKVDRRRVRGWYTDSFQSETLAGYVLQIPARDGAPQYIPATAHSDWDGATVWPLDRYDSANDAARAADSYAESGAEQAREYSDAWQAANRWHELCDEIAESRAKARQLVADIRKIRREVSGPESVCAALRAQVAAMLASWQELRDEREKLADEFTYRDSDGRAMDIAEFAL